MKKTLLRTAVCVALLFSLTATNAMAAGKKKKKSKNVDQFPSAVKQTDENGKVYDFDGMHVDIIDWWSGKDSESKPPVSPSDEATRAWRKWSGQAYNFSVTQKQFYGWDTHPEQVANYCISGGKENYIFIVDARSGITGINSGLFYDLSKIKGVNWNAKKWNKVAQDMLKRGNSFYATSYTTPEPRGGVFFNKRILEECGIDPELPYDLQKQNKWTWETFEELCKKCTKDIDNDGIMDIYGMANSSTEFCPLAAASNGSTFIGRDANGKFTNLSGTDKTIESLEWAAHMATNYEMPQPEGTEWNWMYAAFINGQVAFQVDQLYKVDEYSVMKDDWGFVCFPLGPHGDGVYKTLHNENMFVIPAIYGKEKAEKIAKIFDLWTEPTPGYDDPEAWKEAYYPRFRDSRAVDETLVLMTAVPNPRFDTLIPGINYMGDMIWSVYPGYETPQQAYEKAKPIWDSLLKEANK